MTHTSDFSHHVERFITDYSYYTSWSALESDLRALCNNLLQIKSVELIKLDDENINLYEKVLKSKASFEVFPTEPFPITLIHHNQQQQAIALTRIGQKKSKEAFTKDEIATLKHLQKYLNQQVQYLKEINHISHNLNIQTAKFQDARGALKNMAQVKDNFLSIASHELRTPMSVIRGYADFLLSENFGAINDQQRNFLEKILTNTNRLTSLVNSMLDVSKLEAGKMEFSRQEFDLVASLKAVVKDHQVLMNKKQQELSFVNEATKSVIINSDTEKISLVLANLISNAYKFSPVQSAIIISLQPRPESDLWWIKVSDTGIGINDANKNGLFEKFQQVDNSLQKKHAGTGLGLSICREIVEQLGGKIWIEDNPHASSGAVFNFTLPA